MRAHFHVVADYHLTPADPLHTCLLQSAEALTDCITSELTPESVAQAREIAEGILSDVMQLQKIVAKPFAAGID